ncbi:peptidoglycan-binding protein [Jeotgalibacillus salarius]|uniref:Peptidase M15 n=1 Tax=Jeotgalibacillus salarius TaxID=546023 RepID=A0A4Y8LJY6_9BACL|nr:M15 family metallopeptidase [Jeotgalibacillus salarius]TFE02895.1 hypothetical protein E2626_03560 [Jeotgalibacillus salarius]
MSRVPLQTLIDRSVRNMGAVVPQIRSLAITLITKSYDEGINVQISSGYRSNTQQASIYGMGRPNYWWNGKLYGNEGSIVSNAKPGQSVHNYGLAIDYFLVSDDGLKAIWVVDAQWRRVAQIGKSLGFTWGGDWKGFVDAPHLEYTKGLTWRDLQAGKRPSFGSVQAASERDYLENGAEGAAVEEMQKLLIALGHKITADGIFGPASESALKAFQSSRKLTADGVYGPQSKKALQAAVKPPAVPGATAPNKNDSKEETILFKPNSPTFRKETVKLFEDAHTVGIFSSREHAEQTEKGDISESDAIGAIATIINRVGILQDPNAEPYPAHKEATEWVKEKGISDGTRPTFPATRQQVNQMLYNYDKQK